MGTLALLLASCGTTTTTSGAPKAKDQVLHMTWNSGGGAQDIPTLDPSQAQDSASIPLVDLIFDGLITLDKNLKPEMWGADKVDVSSDGMTYTFHVRSGQEFSNGKAVKASDYAWAMNRALDPCVASPVAGYLAGTVKDGGTFNGETCDNGKHKAATGQTSPVIDSLVGTSIIADDSASTLKVILGAPAGYFLDVMTYSTSFALDQSIVTGANLGADGKWLDSLATGSTGQGGSGMFYVSKWNHTGDLILKPNPNWWGVKAGKAPTLTEIDFKIFENGDTLYNSYQAGTQYDYSDGIPAAQIAAAKGQPDYYEYPALTFFSVSMNWKFPPFDNLDARQALCLAINRDTIVQSVFKGNATPSWHIVPKGMPGYNTSLQGIEGAPTAGDAAKAKAHWDKYLASVNNKVPAIHYAYNPSSSTATLYAQALQGMWNAALPGSNVQLETRDWKGSLKLRNAKQLPFYRDGWGADYPDPQDFLTLLFDTNAPYNLYNASIPAADKLMEAADQISDQSQQADRMSKYNQAEQMLVDNVATCPVYQSTGHYRVRTWVKGDFVQTAQGQFPLDAWATAYIAQH